MSAVALSRSTILSDRLTLFMRLFKRAVLFVPVWWILAEGDSSSWVFGVPFVVFASVVSVRLTPHRSWRLRPLGVIRFSGFFIYNSVVSGVDVALRAVRPSMPISPTFVTYPLRLRESSARVLLVDTLNLLPGTLSSGLEGDTIIIHVLDDTLPVVEEVRRIEEYIVDALGAELVEPPGISDACSDG